MRTSTLVGVALCCLTLVSLAQCLSLQVEPKVTECFSETFARHRQVKLNWQVVRGGLLDINVLVRYDGTENENSPTPDILFEKLYFEKDHAPGNFEFITRRQGVYSFCFDNTMSRFTAKVIQFNYFLHDKWGIPDADDDETEPAELLEPMDRSARRISEELDILAMHQKYIRNREMRHRWTQKSTNSRIFWLSIVESFVLLSISFAQVYYIKRFFKNNRRMI